ncbi:MAG TPA: hypothetical protein VFO46_02455 [Candidatus Sulfotelmatobacter sp.]|nr:hypothetical protein [Candidatus Sulfotelmatobacter sp.]
MLRSGYYLLAQRLQEAADMGHNDVRSRLSDAVNDLHRGTGKYGYLVDYMGDCDSGDCVYYSDGDLRKAPYEISSVDGKSAVSIDHGNSKNVVPVTSYQEEAEDDDHYNAMEESFRDGKLYESLPVYERFIGKSERENADSGSFAGKGKSFPILKGEDVSAAAHALGRAGSSNFSTNKIKANIIRIAKAKGWSKFLPKAWQDGNGTETSEANRSDATTAEGQALTLIESSGPEFLTEIRIQEAASRTNYPVKLISPGTGSRAHYPEQVLERDGPKVFKAGTLMFWNHPTKAEEAARPEGNLDNLAAILTKDAWYDKAGPKGPGLYSEAKVMADYAEKVAERAPHIGLSIRGGGHGTGREVNGQPELKTLDYAESVDYVTKAGRGGLALAEAARDAGILPKESMGMSEDEAKKLIEAAVSPFRLKALKSDAREEATRLLESVTLPGAAKDRIIVRCLESIPEKAGELDAEKFRESVVAEAKAEGEYLATITGAGRVRGMGAGVAANLTEADKKALADREAEDEKLLRESSQSAFGRLMNGNSQAAKAAAERMSNVR